MARRQEPDGRVARGARNRQAIVDATYALIAEGVDGPTAEQIAARAAVGVRTVFRQFAELDVLFSDVAARVTRELFAHGPPPPPTGVLDTDLRALVARRARGYERVAPFLRAARRMHTPPSLLHTQQLAMQRGLRAGLEHALAPHLVGAGALVLSVLEVLVSFEAWEQLRMAQRLSVAAASEAVVTGCRALLMA